MNFDFELILFWVTVVSGCVYLFDCIFLKRRRKRLAAVKHKQIKPSALIEFANAVFPIFLIVFILRSFLFEPFRIPTGSLEPTLLMGDFILANKYAYGIRLPVIHQKIVDINNPKRGDIIVFHWPPDPSYYFIKRVIGLPGDHIDYVDKVLTINGKQMSQIVTADGAKFALQENGLRINVVQKEENLVDLKHQIYQEPAKVGYNFQNIVVPEGMYLVMGDNRDDSADSRYWGFVPDENIVGKAEIIWMSWNPFADLGWQKIRWQRIGRWVN